MIASYCGIVEGTYLLIWPIKYHCDVCVVLLRSLLKVGLSILKEKWSRLNSVIKLLSKKEHKK